MAGNSSCCHPHLSGRLGNVFSRACCHSQQHQVLLVKKNGGHRIGNCLFLPQGCLLNKNQQMPIRESFFISLGSLQYIVGETSMPYNLIININKFLKISRHIKSHFYVCLIEKEVFNLKRYIFVIKPNLGPFACPQ